MNAAVPPRSVPELLAPAGTIEMFFAALEQGADAVYLGTPRFNARLRARNVTMEELGRMVAYAHAIGRKVYVALNTVVKQQELGELIDVIDALRRIGPDALIIQEMAVYRLARALAPELALHASTQMTIHNLDGALQAQRMGLERAILARELTLEEIKWIRRGSEIALEVFIHGAMCYSISGQCYFSSYAHGKSANRGRCLQPCRRLYDIGDERYPVFAPLDLNTAPVLFQLIKAGISSLKIEGRLKPAESIAQTVKAYRILLDAYPHSSKEVIAEARNRLKLAIGRKQSTGFYLAPCPTDTMVGHGMSRAGRYLGKAMNVQGGSFELKTHEVVRVGDRLSIQKSRFEAPRAFNVKELFQGDAPITRSRKLQQVRIVAPFDVEEGAGVVKSIDAKAVTREAKEHGAKKWPQARQQAQALCAAVLSQDNRGALTLSVTGLALDLSFEHWPSWADENPAGRVLDILNRADGQSTIRLGAVQGPSCPGLVPVCEDEIAQWRCAVLAQIEASLTQQKQALQKSLLTIRSSSEPAARENLLRLPHLADIHHVADWTDTTVTVPLSEVGQADFARTISAAQWRGRLGLELPPFYFTEADRCAVREQLKTAVRHDAAFFVASNIGHFHLLQNYRRRSLRIVASSELHCMNVMCFEQLRDLGATDVMCSVEVDLQTLEGLLNRGLADHLLVLVYGKIPLFYSRHPAPENKSIVRCVVESHETVNVFERNGLSAVVPERDFSARHLIARLHTMGMERFVYDLRYRTVNEQVLREVCAARSTFDIDREDMMNLERGLE